MVARLSSGNSEKKRKSTVTIMTKHKTDQHCEAPLRLSAMENYQTASFTKSDQERAYRIAQQWLRHYNDGEQRKIGEDVVAIFDRWKRSYGIMQVLAFPRAKSEKQSKKQKKKIKNLDAWEVDST